jgi:hypothetical protein
MTNKKQAIGKLNRKGNRRGMHVGPHRFKKGLQRSPQAGRKKGVRNKLTLICGEALATCFESIGGVEGLVAWAAKNDANREAFYTKLWIKLLPVQVKLTEQNLDVVFTSYEALRDELRRTGVPIPERLAPPPVTIDAEVKKVK